MHRRLAFRQVCNRCQLPANDSAGAPTLTDMGASFGIATGGVLTLFIAAPPSGSSVWVRVVDDFLGAVFGQEITVDLPAATQFLSPQLLMNTGATPAAVAFACAGVYVEKDFHKLHSQVNGDDQRLGSPFQLSPSDVSPLSVRSIRPAIPDREG
jgi:hypothetical protein